MTDVFITAPGSGKFSRARCLLDFEEVSGFRFLVFLRNLSSALGRNGNLFQAFVECVVVWQKSCCGIGTDCGITAVLL